MSYIIIAYRQKYRAHDAIKKQLKAIKPPMLNTTPRFDIIAKNPIDKCSNCISVWFTNPVI